MFVELFFYFRPSDFCNLFKVRQHVIGCIDHDIVVGLCSELVMRLSYSIHLGYGKKLLSLMGIEPQFFRLWVVYPTSRLVVTLGMSLYLDLKNQQGITLLKMSRSSKINQNVDTKWSRFIFLNWVTLQPTSRGFDYLGDVDEYYANRITNNYFVYEHKNK